MMKDNFDIDFIFPVNLDLKIESRKKYDIFSFNLICQALGDFCQSCNGEWVSNIFREYDKEKLPASGFAEGFGFYLNDDLIYVGSYWIFDDFCVCEFKKFYELFEKYRKFVSDCVPLQQSVNFVWAKEMRRPRELPFDDD
jgi:hypothetical protein